jgi:hypothetical protein
VNLKTVVWAVAIVIAWASLAMLTPERIGERLWSVVRIPVVLFLIVSWFGFVLAAIAQATAPKGQVTLEATDVDLSDAVRPEETIIASARLGTKLTVLSLGVVCTAFAVWDGLVRTPPHWLQTGIWASAAGALAGYLCMLMQRKVVLAPSAISWRQYGCTISRNYGDVADFRVLSGSGIQILFSDGQKVTVTSDMADLKKILATVTARRLS